MLLLRAWMSSRPDKVRKRLTRVPNVSDTSEQLLMLSSPTHNPWSRAPATPACCAFLANCQAQALSTCAMLQTAICRHCRKGQRRKDALLCPQATSSDTNSERGQAQQALALKRRINV